MEKFVERDGFAAFDLRPAATNRAKLGRGGSIRGDVPKAKVDPPHFADQFRHGAALALADLLHLLEGLGWYGNRHAPDGSGGLL
jgi:hypothetical protein